MIQLRRRKIKTKRGEMTYNGTKVKKFQEYEYSGFLSRYEEICLEEIREAISFINLYCTVAEWDNFLNNVIMTGNSEAFMEKLRCRKLSKTNNYILDAKEIYPVKIK